MIGEGLRCSQELLWVDLLVWRAGGVPVAATGEQIRRGALGVEGGHSVRLQGEQVLPQGEPGAVGRG